MNIKDQIEKYIKLGLILDDAIAKACADIVLYKIANSSTNKNVTIKGGIVMMTISKDLRRATRDLDLDFIKYSLSDKSIIDFIAKLNDVNSDVALNIKLPIKELKHQDYRDKRVIVGIKDKFQNYYDFKL